MSKQLFLIDAHALCYRAFYAIKDLATTKGQATNAVYGFTNTLKKILREYKPDYLAVCFDSRAKTHRQEKFAEYKIHRPTMPDDLRSQIPIIKEVVSAYNLSSFEMPGFEADDIIATIAKNTADTDVKVVIVSDDKDMFQLVGEKVRVFSARKDKFLSNEDVKDALGIEPVYVPDYIGLAGDKTDNIPGVMGIGAVAARKLINQYGSIENILKNVEQLEPPGVRDKLNEQQERALLSKELALLDTNVAIDFNLEALRVREPDNKQLFEMFNDLEFRRWSADLAEEVQVVDKLEVRTVKTADETQAVVAQLQKVKQVAFLLDYSADDLIGGQLTLCSESGEVYCVAAGQISQFKPVFENPEIVKITHDVKDKLKVLESLNCEIKGGIFDVMLAGYLLVPSSAGYDIRTLAWQYLKLTISDAVDSLPRETKAVYQLYDLLEKDLREKDLLKLFDDIEIPLAYVLFRMEKQGVKLDSDLLKELSQECSAKITGLVKQLFDLAGEEFNLNSPKQLSHILFDKLNLPVIKKTKTGFSTNEEVLKRLAPQHPLPALILEYRQLAKLKSTYFDALPKLIDNETGKIHAVFNQTGTETGRLSSNNPNLQNIPIRTELGRQIRRAFIPEKKGNIIIAADYSQIELRILAHLSGDENLSKAFKNDQDVHASTAALIFDVAEEDVTKEMRNTAKRVNFGIIYGMSAFGLAKDLEISNPEAQEFIDRYFLQFPGVKVFMEEEIRKCEKIGFVVTLLNRRRYIPEINNRNNGIRQFAQRQAINTPVQGSAADLMKLAMINLQEEMEKQKLVSSMIITVHDEFVFDVPQGEEGSMVDLIRDLMENALSLSVPIRVTVKKGANWLEMEEVKS